MPGADEILHFHLLELAHPENEPSCDDLVAKGLSDLRNAERHLLPGRFLGQTKIYEDTLGRFRTKVDFGLVIDDRAGMRFEHQVELPHLGPVEGPGVRPPDLFVENDPMQFLRHIVAMQRRDKAGPQFAGLFLLAGSLQFLDVPLDQVIGPVPALRCLVVDHGIMEGVYMPGRFPDGRMHENSRVESLDIVVPVHHLPPPPLLDVALQLDAQWTIIVRSAETAVNIRRREDESAALGKGNDLFQKIHGRASEYERNVRSDPGMRASYRGRRRYDSVRGRKPHEGLPDGASTTIDVPPWKCIRFPRR